MTTYMFTIGLVEDTICRFYQEETETTIASVQIGKVFTNNGEKPTMSRDINTLLQKCAV